MGRPRKSLEHHELVGSMRKDPQRFREAPVPVIRPIGYPPASWAACGPYDSLTNKRRRALWTELTKDATPGLLKESDRDGLEGLCLLLAKVRWTSATDEQIAKARSGLEILGINPARACRASVLKGK